MKKVVTLVLAIALLLTSVVAIAESHATPNINTFATMKVKYDEANRIYTITLSKPVDRLLIKWAEKGAEPEELAVSEDLTATAIAWGHKYMPGVKGAGTANKNGVTWDYPVKKSEGLVNAGNPDGKAEWKFGTGNGYWDEKNGTPVFVTGEGYKYTATEAQRIQNYLDYLDRNNVSGDVKITMPETIYAKDPVTGSYLTQKVSKTSSDGKTVTITEEKVILGVKPGKVEKVSTVQTIDKTKSTITATPEQAAFLTVQGDWAVSYNRAGKIVKIEYFEGQF